MRTAEQTADDIYDKMLKWQDEGYLYRNRGILCVSAIQCAIIAVDEILNIVHTFKSQQYWMSVKKELETRLNKQL